MVAQKYQKNVVKPKMKQNADILHQMMMIKFAFIKADALNNINHVRNTRVMKKQLIKMLVSLL